MELPSYFSNFMTNIRPSSEERMQYQDAHRELREKLMDDDDLKEIIVTTFLQGSYRRSTILRPEPGEHADVDVAVVTKISKEDTTPEQALKTLFHSWRRITKGNSNSKAGPLVLRSTMWTWTS